MTTTIFKGDSPVIASPEQLVAYFRSGEKQRQSWKVGTEHEKAGFNRKTRQPLPYEGDVGILAVLEAFRSRFGWNPVWEGKNMVALMRGEASITLEPGGQVELSGAVLGTAHDTCRELAQHLRETREISEEMDLVWLTLGRNPVVPTQHMPWMPKERYAIMRRYLPTRGAMALDMMVGTSTVQTNIDYSDEADMARKLRVGMGLAPFLTALYANSPFAHGRPSGYLSARSLIWEHTDADRTDFIPAVFREDFGYRDYADYALDVPMFFIYRDGHYVDYSGSSFQRFLERGLDGHVATDEDWELHLTTLFPLVRLKKYLELRMADVGSLDMICAFVAFTRGVFYDETALREAALLIQGLRVEDYPGLQREAAQKGLRAEALGRPLQEWCRDVLDIAAGGLRRLNALDERGDNELKYLEPLRRIVDTGKTVADQLLELWNGEWAGRIDPVFTSPLTTF